MELYFKDLYKHNIFWTPGTNSSPLKKEPPKTGKIKMLTWMAMKYLKWKVLKSGIVYHSPLTGMKTIGLPLLGRAWRKLGMCSEIQRKCLEINSNYAILEMIITCAKKCFPFSKLVNELLKLKKCYVKIGFYRLNIFI